MCIIDEKQEAVARIRMAIDNNRKARLNLDDMEDTNDCEGASDPAPESPETWQLGSPEGKKMNLRVMAVDLAKVDPQYCSLEEILRDFIARNMPEEAVQLRFEDDIYVSPEFVTSILSYGSEEWYLTQVQRYKYVALKYQSMEDWTEGTDIMRCNPKFHGSRRFDCVVIHDDAPKASVARLCDLFRCWLPGPSKNTLDIALVHHFSPSKWKPRTVWNGCRVLNEEPDVALVQMGYLLRGALVCPVSERAREEAHYIIDSVDADIFLRENS